MKFKKQLYTIEEVCSILDMDCPSHIKTNPKLSRVNDAQYDIVRQSAHDGTLLFTIELFGRAIKNLVNKLSYFKGDNMEDVIDVEYEVGLISLATVFGNLMVSPALHCFSKIVFSFCSSTF